MMTLLGFLMTPVLKDQCIEVAGPVQCLSQINLYKGRSLLDSHNLAFFFFYSSIMDTHVQVMSPQVF